jgi:hypothetical protein
LVRSFKNVRRLIYYGILLLHFAGNFYTSTPVHVHAVVLSGRRIQKKYLPAFLSIKQSFGVCFFEKVFVYACGVNIHKGCQRLNLLRWKIFYEGVIKRNYRLWIFSKVAQRLEIKHLLISVICSKMVSAIHYSVLCVYRRRCSLCRWLFSNSRSRNSMVQVFACIW